MSTTAKRFRVAFSFAGEKRDFVAKVAAILAARCGEAAILYDKYHEAEFARRDLAFFLPELYHDQSDLIVVVICAEYATKEWCGLEWAATFDLLKSGHNSQVMLCRFDHATVKGLFDLAGYVKLDDKTPDVAAQRILERLAVNEGMSKGHYLASTPMLDFRAASSRLTSPTDLLVGRDEERAALDAAWSGSTKKNVVAVVAWGGTGKTALVARWAADTLAKENHGGIERYFDWSFYSQGSGDDKTASADIFIKEALEFFGDREFAASNASGWQKGERLTQLVAEHRSLLILDGLEPLQDAKSGDLRDQSLCALLRGLAAHNQGLCLVTTRQTVPELNTWHKTTAPEWKLERLSKEAGSDLLLKLGVFKSTPTEREQLAADVKGHALTITLLGKYLAEAHGGDIRRRDLVSLSEADDEETNGHAYHVIEAYETWLEKDGRHVELAILRLLGLFDRPAAADCLAALRQPPAIPGLTDTLIALSDAKWNVALQRLVKLGLVEEQAWEPRRVVGYSEEEAEREKGRLSEPQPFEGGIAPSIRISLDAHPLVREYFAMSCRLRETNSEAWRLAHTRVFEHLRDSVPYWPEGLDGLMPLYQAVAHGCHAGRYEQACTEVYHNRILRGTSGFQAYYSTKKLGAIGANLGAVGYFFVTRWMRVSSELEERVQAWLLNEVAFFLRGLGRLSEAREPMRAGLELAVRHKKWKQAAQAGNNLSQLDLTLGDVASAVREGDQSVTFADASEDVHQRMARRASHADVLHQAGEVEAARARFKEAETSLLEGQSRYDLLSSVWGFQFCDLLLSGVECGAWRATLGTPDRYVESSSRAEALHTVHQRATKALAVAEDYGDLLSIALDHLTLGRVAFYGEILDGTFSSGSADHLDRAVNGIRESVNMDDLPRALLTRAWQRALHGRVTEARADLDEAEQIAERGPMPLFLADVYLYRARLFFREEPEAAKQHLAKARELIFKHGYLRRKEELEDAERVILA